MRRFALQRKTRISRETFPEGDSAKYTLRKLCTDISDFEVSPGEQVRIDLDHLSARLMEEGVSDFTLKDPMLMILFEELGTVARVFPSGRMLIQANLREDAERTCELVYRLVP